MRVVGHRRLSQKISDNPVAQIFRPRACLSPQNRMRIALSPWWAGSVRRKAPLAML
jgi:hypothetical protein